MFAALLLATLPARAEEPAGTAPGATRGEVLLDQAMRRVRLDTRVGYELLMFHYDSALDADDAREDADPDDEAHTDWRGARQYVIYDVEPISVLTLELSLGLDLPNIEELFRIDLGYATDRVFRSGGSLNGDVGDVLRATGLSRRNSDALMIVASIVGVELRARVASFDSGAYIVRPFDGGVSQRGELRFEWLDLSASYDILRFFRETHGLREAFDRFPVGVRYRRWSLPRILYLTRDTDGDPEVSRNVYVAETGLQQIPLEYVMLTFGFERGAHVGGRNGVIVGLGAHTGVTVEPVEGVPSDWPSRAWWGLGFDLKLGWGFRLTRPSHARELSLLTWYGADIMMPFGPSDPLEGDGESDLGRRQVEAGGTEFVHGPTVALRFYQALHRRQR